MTPIRTVLVHKKCCRDFTDQKRVASEVQTCLRGCSDLVAAEAVYHSKYLTRFMLNEELEQATDSASKIQGRPEDQMMLHWYKMLCHDQNHSYTLTQLHDKTKEISDI